MEDILKDLFQQFPGWAILLSVLLGILIAILGVVPSFFLTAANIFYFGFWNGTLISFAGEAIGALVAFWLYRKGFRNKIQHKLHKFPRLRDLVNAPPQQAARLVFSFRLLPFLPSGLVTFAASVGQIKWSLFFLASSLGKIPALLLESYSVFQVTNFTWQGKLLLAAIAVYIVVLTWKKISQGRNRINP